MTPPLIQSPRNPRIKAVARLLASRRHRDRDRLTVVEGLREVRRCLDAGRRPTEAFVCEPLLDPEGLALAERLRRTGCEPVSVSVEAFARIAYREESGGIVLVVPYDDTALDRLDPPDPAFLVVVEGAEKPGNVGAILRTADAAGVHGLVLCGRGTDLHNPNVIRASLGTRFTVPCAEAPADEVIGWLRRRGVQPVVATPEADRVYTPARWPWSRAARPTGSPAPGGRPPACGCASRCSALPTASTWPRPRPWCCTRWCGSGELRGRTRLSGRPLAPRSGRKARLLCHAGLIWTRRKNRRATSEGGSLAPCPSEQGGIAPIRPPGQQDQRDLPAFQCGARHIERHGHDRAFVRLDLLRS
ncbi:MAG: RNA methyltransferase [Deltaproteobacteria bacterium]|nr:RNA methyltransferase [Deltaproteobacteria bacterium]